MHAIVTTACASTPNRRSCLHCCWVKQLDTVRVLQLIYFNSSATRADQHNCAPWRHSTASVKCQLEHQQLASYSLHQQRCSLAKATDTNLAAPLWMLSAKHFKLGAAPAAEFTC
jgi:hypothetical protein